MSILEGELAATIGDALLDADIAVPVVLTRMLPGGGAAHNPGDPTPEPHTCQGFTDTWEAEFIAGGAVLAGDVKVVIIATTIDIEPQPGDFVMIRGQTYAVINVRTDPAIALTGSRRFSESRGK